MPYATRVRSCARVAWVATSLVACGAPRARDGEIATMPLGAADAGDARRAALIVVDAAPEGIVDAAPARVSPCGLDQGRRIALERWRTSIEGYVPAVRPDNRVALDRALVPFAKYVGEMHKRIHPYFADRFLEFYAAPSQAKLVVRLEIIIGRNGAVHALGVVKSSGVTAFDLGALESVACAAPFGEPAPELRSPDELVYFHWEFHSDPVFSCTTMNARPFLLRAAP